VKNTPRNLSGHRFGRLIPRRIVANNPVIWECECDCGCTCRVRASQFVPSKRQQSCGCVRREVCGNRVRKRPFEWLYNTLKDKSNRRGKHFELTFDEFVSFTLLEECHYCGDHLVWNQFRQGGYQGYNLDCKDNSKGYISSNLVPCCARCNGGKSDLFTYEEWVEIGKCIRRMREAQ
jgi:hypothetical protein